ncbi:transposase [Streptomyces violaceusniger]|uniref:Transposase IS3/IS911 family protein n=1 Tax=Streptomyces violaceusniger (strain Tu 4113) TaxID=653045 RepID=G2PGE5_STRV4|nr:transposase [Streptomyces violaceusniger]AEM85524.1 transposase IS3/IS911 family protein [Streptomyces violaceusniger Tu 4113]
MPAPRKYPLELRERAVRMYRASEPKPVIRRLAEELGVHHEALRNWIRQAEADAGEREDLLTTAEREELVALRKENAQLKRANEVLRTASAFPPRSSTRPGPGKSAHRRAPTPGGRARTPGTADMVGTRAARCVTAFVSVRHAPSRNCFPPSWPSKDRWSAPAVTGLV